MPRNREFIKTWIVYECIAKARQVLAYKTEAHRSHTAIVDA